MAALRPPTNSSAQKRFGGARIDRYWHSQLAGFRIPSVGEPVDRAELIYLDPKEFPQTKNANPKDFFDNSFVDTLEPAGFFPSSALAIPEDGLRVVIEEAKKNTEVNHELSINQVADLTMLKQAKENSA